MDAGMCMSLKVAFLLLTALGFVHPPPLSPGKQIVSVKDTSLHCVSITFVLYLFTTFVCCSIKHDFLNRPQILHVKTYCMDKVH